MNNPAKKSKNRILYFIQETAIVVFGVLIAVSINNYKEKVNNEQYIKKTLSAIENEIKQSQSAVDSTLNRHLKLLEVFGYLEPDDEQTLLEIVAGAGGVQFPTIKNISLRFYISNKAELVEFSVISQLLDIESNSNLLSAKMNRLADYSYENLNNNSYQAKIKFATMLSDVIDSEQTLLELYDLFLDDNQSLLSSDLETEPED
jgi:hypothetical protein